jgi:hypothetical protein
MATRKKKKPTYDDNYILAVGENDFLLKGKDWATPACILFWMAMNVNTAPDEKMKSAFDMVMRTRKVPGRKVAD